MERLVPVRKDRYVNLELRPISKAQDLPIQFQEIVSAVGDGRITPIEAQSLSDILTRHARVMETVELAHRVEELEAHQEEMRVYQRKMAERVSTEGQRLLDEDRKKR